LRGGVVTKNGRIGPFIDTIGMVLVCWLAGTAATATGATDLYVQTYKFSRLFDEVVRVAFCQAPLDAQVLAFDPPELAKAINESIDP
jgi:hypothetical protein